MSFQHPTEELVYKLCRRSFLSLWSYANPRRCGSHEELCDVLVVCEPHVVILSVKYSGLQEGIDTRLAAARWVRRTVQPAIRSLYGAERNLSKASHVTRNNGDEGLPLPPLAERKVHRVAVSLGGRRTIALSVHDGDKGLVHCLDDRSAQIAFGELDTISDFIAYLEAREEFAAQGRRVRGTAGEEDLLAIYLHSGRRFPDAIEFVVDGDLWGSLQHNRAYQRRKDADRVSYAWDNFVEHISEYVLAGRMEFGSSLSENETVLRVMAREPRFARRMLADAFLEFVERAERGETRSRMMASPSGVTYVFFNPPSSYDRPSRYAELGCRCFIARNEVPENETVVGIGTNVQPAPQGYATDLVLLSHSEWTEEHQLRAAEMKEELGFFRQPLMQVQHFDEYPE